MSKVTCRRGECWFIDQPTTLAVLEAAEQIASRTEYAVIDKETLKLVPLQTNIQYQYIRGWIWEITRRPMRKPTCSFESEPST